MSSKFDELETKHIAYNAQRTLRNANPSLFETTNMQGLNLLKDKNIAFANQIWGMTEQHLSLLPQVLALYDQISMPPDLDIIADNLSDTLILGLESLGYEQDEQLNFLSMVLSDAEIKTPQVTVERYTNNQADGFLNLLKTSGMQTTDQIWQLKKHLYCTNVFRCYVAKVNGQPAALATMFVEGQYALLANAFTQPDYQNQGCQTALLQARINDAKTLGLAEIIVDVLPNTSSERNCIKAGFKPLNTRYIWQKKSPT